MNVICPHCFSDDTIPFSDIKTKEFGYTCSKCKKEFGVFDSEKEKKLIEDFKELHIEYFYSETKYMFSFNKTSNSIILKIDTFKNNNHNDYEEVDFSSLFDDFFSVLLHQLFILDIDSKDIDKEKDYFVLRLKSDKEYIKETNNFNYYVDLITKFMFQLLG